MIKELSYFIHYLYIYNQTGKYVLLRKIKEERKKYDCNIILNISS